MTVLITLTTAGADTGPFDLYSNIDGFTSAFETGVDKALLLGGYSSSLVPDGTSVIRVMSNGVCVNYIDLVLITTTTTTSSTTTTTTTIAPNFVTSFTMEQRDDGAGTYWAVANIVLNSPVIVATTITIDFVFNGASYNNVPIYFSPGDFQILEAVVTGGQPAGGLSGECISGVTGDPIDISAYSCALP